MTKKVTEIVEQQISAWSRRNALKFRKQNKEKEEQFPVITISREFGSPGAALARFLGEKTGFKVWDDELLKLIAEELGSDEKFIESLDERRQQAVEDAVAGFLTNVHTNVNYLHALMRVVKTIEEYGSGIIVGRGANFICEHPASLHIRLVAPLKHRIDDYAGKMNLGKVEVERLAEKKDRERSEFIRRNFYKDVSDPLGYDLTINSSYYNLEQMADLVLHAYKIKTGHRPEPVESKMN